VSALEEVGIDPWGNTETTLWGGGRDKTVGFNPTTPTAIQTLESVNQYSLHHFVVTMKLYRIMGDW